MEKKLFQSEIKANNSLHSVLKMEKYCSQNTKVNIILEKKIFNLWALLLDDYFRKKRHDNLKAFEYFNLYFLLDFCPMYFKNSEKG